MLRGTGHTAPGHCFLPFLWPQSERLGGFLPGAPGLAQSCLGPPSGKTTPSRGQRPVCPRLTSVGPSCNFLPRPRARLAHPQLVTECDRGQTRFSSSSSVRLGTVVLSHRCSGSPSWLGAAGWVLSASLGGHRSPLWGSCLERWSEWWLLPLHGLEVEVPGVRGEHHQAEGPERVQLAAMELVTSGLEPSSDWARGSEERGGHRSRCDPATQPCTGPGQVSPSAPHRGRASGGTGPLRQGAPPRFSLAPSRTLRGALPGDPVSSSPWRSQHFLFSVSTILVCIRLYLLKVPLVATVFFLN